MIIYFRMLSVFDTR